MADRNVFTQKPYSSNYLKLLETRKTLPVYKFKEEFLTKMKENKVLLVEGETGSGKTTQLPQFTAEYLQSINDGRLVACTQPRRVAAMSVAERVADEMDVAIGESCGYKIRFDDMTSSSTKLVYLTDGMLLREAMGDPLLSKYKVIMLDESHERTLSTDILMGVIKQLLTKRQDLSIVVMSATLDSDKFSLFFDNAPLLKIPGRTFPVDIFYTDKAQSDYITASIDTVQLIYQHEPEGDILVFLTGEEEIEDTCNRIHLACKNVKPDSGISKVLVLPLYSQLNPQEQRKIFIKTPPNTRKIVVATNVAETSITVDGVVYVVDPGFVKQKAFNPRTRMESLQVTPISQASANQRAGRAGRTRAGKCFRMYTQDAYNDLQPQTYPEMQRSNLTNVILQLARIGIFNIVGFNYLDPPSPETLMRAMEMLHYLGAIDEDGQLTENGKLMADLPLDPEYAKILIMSEKYECVEPILSIVAMLSVANCFLRPPDKKDDADAAKSHFETPEGDHFTLLNTITEFESCRDQKSFCYNNYLNFRNLSSAVRIKEQLRVYLPKLHVKSTTLSEQDPLYISNIKKCLLEGFFSFVAYYDKTAKSYKTVKDNMPVTVHPSSCLNTKIKPSCIMYNEFVQTTRDYIRTCSIINDIWLMEINPVYYNMSNFPECDLKMSLMHKNNVPEVEAKKSKKKSKKKRIHDDDSTRNKKKKSSK